MERRHYNRIPTSGHVLLKKHEEKGLSGKAVLENISFGGFLMNSQEKLIIDSLIDFELTAELSERQVSGSGRIKHVFDSDKPAIDIFKIGVEFIDVDEDSVIYFINRIHSDKSRDSKDKKSPKPIDFIPY